MAKANKYLDRIYRPHPSMVSKMEMERYIREITAWYDSYVVNPMSYYIAQKDISDINEISFSPSLQNKPVEKYNLIGEIMKNRGFTFCGGGTNRRSYACTYDPRVVLKVSTDRVGTINNKSETVNNHILKPFCYKPFEVSECGTAILIERVRPVLTIEDFQSISDRVFDILYGFFRAKNIGMEDIGSRSFKNWGIREGFGPVLLDYPTMHVVDPKKCFCTQLDNYGRMCHGTLDYDEGFDNIVCTVCGRSYLSKSIAKNGDTFSELMIAANKARHTKERKSSMLVVNLKRGSRILNTNCNSVGGTDSFVDNTETPEVSIPEVACVSDIDYERPKTNRFGVTVSVPTPKPVQQPVAPVEEQPVVEVNTETPVEDSDVVFNKICDLVITNDVYWKNNRFFTFLSDIGVMIGQFVNRADPDMETLRSIFEGICSKNGSEYFSFIVNRSKDLISKTECVLDDKSMEYIKSRLFMVNDESRITVYDSENYNKVLSVLNIAFDHFKKNFHNNNVPVDGLKAMLNSITIDTLSNKPDYIVKHDNGAGLTETKTVYVPDTPVIPSTKSNVIEVEFTSKVDDATDDVEPTDTVTDGDCVEDDSEDFGVVHENPYAANDGEPSDTYSVTKHRYDEGIKYFRQMVANFIAVVNMQGNKPNELAYLENIQDKLDSLDRAVGIDTESN